MSLTTYHQKRHFNKTPEPKGKTARGTDWAFVIQKHDASHLHYDFRLELDGVLKSWAVPKGPCLDPHVKRLAVEVEDHPVEYGSFEGTIPQGEYGGGTVLLWDRGTWEPLEDAHAGLRKGRLKFTLHGEKLSGDWMLVRSRASGRSDKPQWLLIKEQDDAAVEQSKRDILEDQPLSVVSARDLPEIAAGAPAKKRVSRKAAQPKSETTSAAPKAMKAKRTSKAVRSTSRKTAPRRATKIDLPDGARAHALPKFVESQLATLTTEAPAGHEWLHEIKFDGYRMQCRIHSESIQFTSRNNLSWTDRLRSLTDAVRELPVKQALLDGEVVALTAEGVTDFQALQNAFREGHTEDLYYYVFDIMHLDGMSLMGCPLEERKRVLAQLLADLDPDGKVRYSTHIDGKGPDFVAKACELDLEGIIAKRRDSIYQPGRGLDWLKVKCVRKEEFVIGGYTEPRGSRSGFGALLVGYHDAEGRLIYAGKVGTGFDEKLLKSMHQQLSDLQQPKCPFDLQASPVRPARTAKWVEPSLVAQIRFGSRTRDGILRHSAFEGLREDKPAGEVVMDQPLPIEVAEDRSEDAAMSDEGPVHTTEPPAKTTRKARGTKKAAHSKKPEQPTPKDDAPLPSVEMKGDEFDGVRLTSPDKLLYPAAKITKLDLAAYLRDVADWILPHIAHRPLVLVRCPDGQKKACFYQKHPSQGSPEHLRELPIQEKNKREPYVLVDNVAGLISLAQISALEIHAWGSREDALDKPDRLIFDLDPDPGVAWEVVVDSAFQIRDFLQELGLTSFLKTTGGKGLHLVVPIERRHAWPEVKAFCKLVADTIVSIDPGRYVAKMAKAARTDRIFVDYLRNDRGSTAVVPYSPRSKDEATVSVPLEWSELDAQLRSDQFTIKNIRQRLASLKQDPWAEMVAVRQTLSGPIKKLNSLTK